MATKATTPRKAAAKRKAQEKPEQTIESVEDAAFDGGDSDEAGEPDSGIPPHPYGDIEVYVYHPKDGSAPIVMPHISEVRPTQKFFWKIYRLNEMFQSFEWLNLANVPRPIQERIMDLGEKDVFEQAELFRGWFAPITRPQGGMVPPGES